MTVSKKKKEKPTKYAVPKRKDTNGGFHGDGKIIYLINISIPAPNKGSAFLTSPTYWTNVISIPAFRKENDGKTQQICMLDLAKRYSYATKKCEEIEKDPSKAKYRRCHTTFKRRQRP